jgi:hypothetical protein
MANGHAEVEPCPYCRGTSVVEVITDAPPKVQAWSCSPCGTDWAVTVVNPHLRPLLDQLAEDVAARAVLAEVIALREQAPALTDGQLRTQLINCLVRLDQICRWGADPHAPAGTGRTTRFPVPSRFHPSPHRTATAPGPLGERDGPATR